MLSPVGRSSAVPGVGVPALLLVSAALIALSSSATAQRRPDVVELRWTKAGAEAYEALPPHRKATRALPEVRVYDAQRRLVMRSVGVNPRKLRSQLIQTTNGKARQVAGPSFAQAMAELEFRDGKPARTWNPRSRYVVLDYWAEWCVPCKIVEKDLLAWAAERPAVDVSLARAETDLMAAAKAKGGKVYMLKKGPDGRMVKTEM